MILVRTEHKIGKEQYLPSPVVSHPLFELAALTVAQHVGLMQETGHSYDS